MKDKGPTTKEMQGQEEADAFATHQVSCGIRPKPPEIDTRGKMGSLVLDLKDIGNNVPVKIEFNLHTGFRKLIDAFGTANMAMAWLVQYSQTRKRDDDEP